MYCNMFPKMQVCKTLELVVDLGLWTVEELCMWQEFAILKHLDCELEASELKVVCIRMCVIIQVWQTQVENEH